MQIFDDFSKHFLFKLETSYCWFKLFRYVSKALFKLNLQTQLISAEVLWKCSELVRVKTYKYPLQLRQPINFFCPFLPGCFITKISACLSVLLTKIDYYNLPICFDSCFVQYIYTGCLKPQEYDFKVLCLIFQAQRAPGNVLYGT